MMKEDEMQTLASVVDSMHKLAEGLETLAIYLLRDAGEQQAVCAEIPVFHAALPSGRGVEIHWHSLFPSHTSQLGDSGSKRLAHAAGRLEKDKLEAFFAWLEGIQPKTLPKSALGKAVSYALNHRKGGGIFLRDGNIAASAAVCNFQVSGVK